MHRILVVHNYVTVPVDAISSPLYHRSPTPAQVGRYDLELVRAVRGGNIEKLREIKAGGVSLDACNRFGESVLHMTCRRGEWVDG